MSNTHLRESNLELLRIVAMVYIVAYHLITKSLDNVAPELSYLTQAITSILHIGVICFVLISGYWGIKFSLKGFVKLFTTCSFYSVLIYLTYVFFNPEQFNTRELLNSFLPFQWWYIQVYLGLYLLIPILKMPLERATKDRKLFYLLILGIVSYGFGQFVPSLSGGKNVVNFAFIYYLGNYLRYNFQFRTPLFWLYYGLFNAAIFSTIYFTQTVPSLRFFLFNHVFFPYNSIGLIANATLLFLCFRSITIRSRAVNWMAVSMLPVYLLHENDYLSQYLYGFLARMYETAASPQLFLLSFLLIVLAVIVTCVGVDKLMNPIIVWLQNIITENSFFLRLNRKVHKLLSQEKIIELPQESRMHVDGRNKKTKAKKPLFQGFAN